MANIDTILLLERQREMQNIQKEYSILFNVITDTETELKRLYIRLMEAQQMAEELYISAQDSNGTGTNGAALIMQ
jgi:hypothetical protein